MAGTNCFIFFISPLLCVHCLTANPELAHLPPGPRPTSTSGRILWNSQIPPDSVPTDTNAVRFPALPQLPTHQTATGLRGLQLPIVLTTHPKVRVPFSQCERLFAVRFARITHFEQLRIRRILPFSAFFRPGAADQSLNFSQRSTG